MLFYTKKFLIFWIISLFVHFVFQKDKFKWQLSLLVFSCLFYAQWDKRFLILVFMIALSDFVLGILIEDTENQIHKRRWMILSVAINLIALGFFKYFNFFAASLSDMGRLVGFRIDPFILKIVLPIGISFFTFESLSYIVEVYRGHMKASRNFIEYFLFIAFFPHLVAGPIIQPRLLIEQFREGPKINQENLKAGLWRFFLGLSKKLLLADQLAFFVVDPVFAHPNMFSSLESFVGVIAYSFQIYFDFSGYSDMALGLAKMYGFDLPENFNFPYLADSVRDFWKRWHISLSTWLRDYLYISLGGNRGSEIKKYRNVFLTMLLGGIWHGASYNFVIWGALHGIFITCSHFLNDHLKLKINSQRYYLFNVITVFLLVSFAWIFFRAQNVSSALLILNNIARFDLNYGQLPGISSFLVSLSVVYFIAAKLGFFNFMRDHRSKELTDLSLTIIILIVCLVLTFDKQYSPFIYFQF